MFHLDGLNVAYNGSNVLHDIQLDIRAGEKVVLIGPSGSGKTTLLRKLHQMAQTGSAFIHQDHALVPTLSVYQNVFNGGLDRYSTFHCLRNLLRPTQPELIRITEILVGLEMADKIFEPVGRLSGGQRQRTAVARAIFHGGDLLLADEPVSSVDPMQANKVLSHLGQGFQTVVVSLHQQGLESTVFDRVIGLRGGRVLFDQPANGVDESLLHDLYQPC